MHKNGHLTEGKVIQRAATPLRAPHLEDEAERLFQAYLDTFQQAPESDFGYPLKAGHHYATMVSGL
jgi:hypothetical protein